MNQVTITINIPASNPIDENSTKNKLQAIANLSTERLDKMHQISINEKALCAIEDKWSWLKMMF